MEVDSYQKLAPDAGMLFLYWIVGFGIINALCSDERRKKRLSSAIGCDERLLPEWAYKRPWLDRLPFMYVLATLGGPFLGAFTGYLAEQVSGLNLSNEAYWLIFLAFGVGLLVSDHQSSKAIVRSDIARLRSMAARDLSCLHKRQGDSEK